MQFVFSYMCHDLSYSQYVNYYNGVLKVKHGNNIALFCCFFENPNRYIHVYWYLFFLIE